MLRACKTFGEKASAAERLRHTFIQRFAPERFADVQPKKGEFCTLHSYQTFCTERLLRKRLARRVFPRHEQLLGRL